MQEGKVTLAQIQAAIAESGAEWQAGATSVSELPPDEQKLRLGVQPPPGGFDSVLRNAAAARAMVEESSAGLPAAYDLRNVGGKNFITPIRDQGSCGSCVAFGTIASIEGQFRVQRNDPNLAVDLSEAHLFFCLGKAQGVTCATGWMPDKAFECATNTGIADEACYPYNTAQTGCTSANLCSDWQSRALKITGYGGVSAAQIKTILTTKGPVGACFVVYNDFFSYRSGVYRHVSGAQAGGHCVSIIGYDDALGCWICKNSWGAGWGESGFFRIAYGEVGIDSWANHAANAIVETMWLNGRKVMGLWTIDQDRNAWAYLDGGVGWRRIAYDNDNIFMDLLTPLVAAKAANRPVNVYEEAGVLKQLYVL
jgi:C1A family cysteine protease